MIRHALIQFVILFLLLASNLKQAQGSTLDLILRSQKIQTQALNYFLSSTCQRANPGFIALIQCQATARAAVGLLNPQPFLLGKVLNNKDFYLTIVFSDELKKIGQAQKNTEVLRQLLQRSDDLFKQRQTFNVYEELKALVGPDEATRWMAVVFQDTTEARSVAEYMTKYRTQFNDSFIKSYEELINKIVEDSFNESGVIELWPKSLKGMEYRSQVYHYFVPKYLIMRLHQLHKPGISRHAALVAQMFVGLYELTEGAQKPFAILRPSFSELDSKSLDDVYATYLAVCTSSATFEVQENLQAASCLTRNEYQRSTRTPLTEYLKRIARASPSSATH